ncbi:MAG TPA: reverse transcriptase domain-containing protein [Allosphingosinicella sp.]
MYMASVLPEGGTPPSSAELHRFLLEASDMRQIVRVSRDPDLFSLTLHGSYYLSREQRLSRDRERLFLLRDTWPSRYVVSLEEAFAGSDGAAPSHDVRTWIKGSGANKPGPCVPRVRSYWPRISRQLAEATGPLHSSSDTFLDLLSFATERQLELARSDGDRVWDYTSIGLSLGVSPRLLLQMAVSPERHYRTFQILKRGGGGRTIQAPRVFLKAVQKFIADYLLCDLRVHDAVHAFVPRRSAVSNAHEHLRSRWVGTIDVESFFPSISGSGVEALLRRNGFDATSARTIRRLCTYEDAIPQGAPSSPVLSNAYLFEADVTIAAAARQWGVRFTRYADDLTFSGEGRSEVASAMADAERVLSSGFGLRLNKAKSRIIGPSGRRVVTGATVNDAILPGRQLRRGIRAAAFNLSRQSTVDERELLRIEGYQSYFMAFPRFRENIEAARLRAYIATARSRIDGKLKAEIDP